MVKLRCLIVFSWGLFALASPTGLVWGQSRAYERPPIDYPNTPGHDEVAQLAEKLANGTATLKFDRQTGYLVSLLEQLKIPTSSQVLVFSKTSLQLSRISPKTPRAIYFNDDVYVGYCHHGDVLEIAATDPQQGALFYTLPQDSGESPRIKRDQGNCLSCHASHRTQNVPGYLIRSVYPDSAGQPKYRLGTFTTDSTSPFSERWGGWYVTGNHGTMRHMGNGICQGDQEDFDRDKTANQNKLASRFSTQRYLTPHSDIVALMVLGHQTQMHNAITAANYETRLALHQSFEMNRLLDRPADHVSESAQRRIDTTVDKLLKHLLFCDEFQLSDAVSGSSDFAQEFKQMGQSDSRGRSLRDFDLKKRLFRYPCSYLIHSDAFLALPELARDRLLGRLRGVLLGKESDEEFSHLDRKTRREIHEILLETHTGYASTD